MDSRKRNFFIFQIFSFLLLIICLLGTINFFRLKKYNTITADESSEMLLGNILASENSLISKNWYYSTELEVLNTNIFYSFFFRLTDNWHRVRLFSVISMYFVMLGVHYGMSRVFRFSRFFALSAAVLFIPFSADYYDFVLKGAYYFPVITTSAFTLLIAEISMKLSGRKSCIFLFLSFVFSILIGLGGSRQLFFTYIPLFAASGLMMVWKKSTPKSDRWFIFSAVSFLGSVIGHLINSIVLSKIYSFDTWSAIKFVNLDFARVGEIINGIFSSFGYLNGYVFSDVLLNNAVCFVWIFLTIWALWYALKNHAFVSDGFVRLAVFIGCSYLFYIGFYALTSMYHNARYNMPIVCLSIPLIAVFFEQLDWKKSVSAVVLSLLVLGTAVCGLNYYITKWDYDPNAEVRRVARALTEQGYFNGYASFWHANNITEFSDGRIEVWCPIDGSKDLGFLYITDIDQTYKWLQKVSHDTTHPAGKTFLLFSAGEYENNPWRENLEESDIIYRSPEFIIFGYRDYDHMIDSLYPGYEFSFDNNQWVDNGLDVNNSRELYQNGVSFGPYQTLWSGVYEINVRGNNLSDTEIVFAEGTGTNQFNMELMESNNETQKFKLSLPEKIYDFEVIIKNTSGDPDSVVKIDSIRISRVPNP